MASQANASRSTISRYAMTLGVVGLITGFKFVLLKYYFYDAPMTLYYTAVILSAIYGGPLQGILASLYSMVAAMSLFMAPEHLFSGPHTYGIKLISFTVDTGVFIFLVWTLQNARRRAEVSLERANELQDAAAHLKESQDFLDSVIENIPAMVFVKDARNLRFVRFNRAGELLVGHSRDKLIGKNDFDFFPKDQADFFVNADRRVLEGGQVVDIDEEPISTPDGIHYLHTRKIPLLDSDGRPAYLLGISEDITQQKVAEQQRLKLVEAQAARAQIERTADQMRFLSEASAALSESLDLKSCLNAFTKTLISYLGDWCEIVILEENALKVQEAVIAHRDPAKKARADAFRAQHSVDWEQPVGVATVIQSGKPELYPSLSEGFLNKIREPMRRQAVLDLGIHSVIIVPLHSYGRVIGALSVCSAESKRTYNEFDLSLVMDLAKRASFAIENSRLFKKAQEANLAKSAFLANMSHEIRTPLGAMLGFAELLADDTKDPKQHEYVSTLLRNGQQLLRIVDEILDLSKVESDRIQIEHVSFSLPHLMEDVTALLELQALDRGLCFKAHGLTELPATIISDPTRIRQIVINVIGNAIKFTHRGGVEVSVRVDRRGDLSEHSILEIRVADTGIGISKEQCEKLFQPFSQADDSTSRKYGGTGLGLFLARRLARMMGGDVVLGGSELGKGSEFVITLDVKQSFEDTQLLAPTLKVEEAGRGEGHILVVDDSADNRMLIQLFLSRMGYQADTADSGQEAVARAFSNKYDLILMDVQMPVMDGFEALAKLRERGVVAPVVALTAHTMKGDRERCLAGGFDDFLGKPIDRELLKKCLERHIHQTPEAGARDSSLQL